MRLLGWGFISLWLQSWGRGEEEGERSMVMLLLPACSWEPTVIRLLSPAVVSGEKVWKCDPGAPGLSAEALWDGPCSH